VVVAGAVVVAGGVVVAAGCSVVAGAVTTLGASLVNHPLVQAIKAKTTITATAAIFLFREVIILLVSIAINFSLELVPFRLAHEVGGPYQR
jgi:hypothetical protein